MKKWIPPAVLAAILALSLWNAAAMEACVARWRDQLQQADALVDAEDWPALEHLLADSYQDWSAWQTYLHIVTEHDAVDDAESMYRRCMAFAAAREPSELRAETADLRDQLRLLAEMERLNWRNIL